MLVRVRTRGVTLACIALCFIASLCFGCSLLPLLGDRGGDDDEGAAPAEPQPTMSSKSSSSAVAPPAVLLPAAPPRTKPTPLWLGGGARNVGMLYATAKDGPIAQRFEGALVCLVSVTGYWDDSVPIVGSQRSRLPDITVRFGERGGASIDADQPAGHLMVANQVIEPDDLLAFEVVDRDALGDDDRIGGGVLKASAGFPLLAKGKSYALRCRGLSSAKLAPHISKRARELQSALGRMSIKADIRQPDVGRRLSGIEAAREAVNQLGALVGWRDRGSPTRSSASKPLTLNGVAQSWRLWTKRWPTMARRQRFVRYPLRRCENTPPSRALYR